MSHLQQLGAVCLCGVCLTMLLCGFLLRPAVKGIGGLKGPYHLVDLNNAGASELALLPGIGTERAKRILELKERLGEIRTWREVESVKGIGAVTIQEMKGMCKGLEP